MLSSSNRNEQHTSDEEKTKDIEVIIEITEDHRIHRNGWISS
jgi:hypothetical protein